MSTHEHQSILSEKPPDYHASLHIEARIRHDLQGAADRIEDVLSRLERLDDQGHIKSHALVGWGCQACSPVDPPSNEPIRPKNVIQATIDEFNKWATQHEYSLGPAFGQSTDEVNAEAERQITVHVICLAVYDCEDDSDEAATSEQVVAVYPYIDEKGDVKTVENGLNALEDQSNGR